MTLPLFWEPEAMINKAIAADNPLFIFLLYLLNMFLIL